MVPKVQGWILALGTAGIAATGAIFGAQLKAEKEAIPPIPATKDEPKVKAKVVAVEQPRRDPSIIAQHITSLEAQRSQLMSQRYTVERKLAALQDKMVANEEKEKRRVVGQEILDKK